MNSSKSLIVGFQNRSDTYSGKLGFILPENHDNPNFNFWRDKTIPTQVINNIPMSGFVLNKNIKRLYEYSKSEKMRVFHPLGFEFEINMDNLALILTNTDISAQEVMCECIIGWSRGNVYLIPAHSEEGKKLVIQNQKSFELSIGNKVTMGKKKDEYIYLGLLKTTKYIKYDEKLKQSNISSHYFFNINNQSFTNYKKLPDITFASVGSFEETKSLTDLLKFFFNHKIQNINISTEKMLFTIYNSYTELINISMTNHQKQKILQKIFSDLESYIHYKHSFNVSFIPQTLSLPLDLSSIDTEDKFKKLFKPHFNNHFKSNVFFFVINKQCIFMNNKNYDILKTPHIKDFLAGENHEVQPIKNILEKLITY